MQVGDIAKDVQAQEKSLDVRNSVVFLFSDVEIIWFQQWIV